MLQSGTLARLAGVNKQTVRYYERIGLIEPAGRSDSGYRMFDPEVVDRVRFIRRAQELGFQLAEIQELLGLRVDGRTNCDRVRGKAREKREAVRRKIQELRGMERVLDDLIVSCAKRSSTGACPILAALETNGGSKEQRTDIE